MLRHLSRASLVAALFLCAACVTQPPASAAATTVPAPRAAQIAPPTQYGFVGGVLTIPFKFHLSDDSMTGGSTLGGYLGWKASWMGLTATPIVSAGMAMPTGNYGPGLTVATGLIGSVASSPIDWGIVLGADWFAKSANYPYEGKPWIAVEIGYKFGSP